MFGVLVALIAGCQQVRDDAYYLTHPEALFSELTLCKTDSSIRKTCEHLGSLAMVIQKIAVTLQEDPFLFGQEIIKLEMSCANSEIKQQEKTECNDNLKTKLAVIKWLESPERKT